MSIKTAPLWDWASRAEAFELLEQLWTHGGEDTRSTLLQSIAAGPPSHLGSHENDPIEREKSRDHRIFDRLSVLARIDSVASNELAGMLANLQRKYPDWKLPEGERARFSFWTQFRHGLETSHASEDFQDLADSDILESLTQSARYREGDLDSWRRFVASNTQRGVNVLSLLLRSADGGAADIWRATLWGLRDNMKELELRADVIQILTQAADPLFQQSDFNEAVADIMEALLEPGAAPSADYWKVFDRALLGTLSNPENSDDPEKSRWVDLAINRSLGKVATAFFNGLFAYRLKGKSGIPDEQLGRIESLLGFGKRQNLLARVIAASRLPYLFAIDPEWCRRRLLPSFDWSDATEALAVWQGFAWHPSVSPELWVEIRKPFFEAFSENRLIDFGPSARTMAQLLVLAGIEFQFDETPSDTTRKAIRGMTSEMRTQALWWLWNYISQRSDEVDASGEERADTIWRDRIKPWLKRWPRDPALRTAETGESFALIATATFQEFPNAVTFLDGLFVRSQSGRLLIELNNSFHPDSHPEEVLKLIWLSIDLDGYWPSLEMKPIVERILKARPELQNNPKLRLVQQKLATRM